MRVPELRGRIAELREPYRGPLDHVIPYLAERYPNPAELVIATNYEDFSYMFYLRATTMLGYYAPERERDLAFVPDVIIPRPWPVNLRALEHLAKQRPYRAARVSGRERAREQPAGAVAAQSVGARPPLPLAGARPDGAALVIGERRQP